MLTTSLYEYCAGFMWGGFEYPQSKTSAVFQILLGFIVLVLVSSYTANLAAFVRHEGCEPRGPPVLCLPCVRARVRVRGER